jgi:hypothetical protein
MFSLSRRLLAALFLTSATTAAWAGCCDGDAPGRTTRGGALACPCVGAAPAKAEAPVGTHSGSRTRRLDGKPASNSSNVADRGSKP